MKAKFTLFATLFVAFFGLNAQQLDNLSFNNWTDTLTPDGWVTLDKMYNLPIGLAQRDAVDRIPQLGAYSLKLTTDSVFIGPNFYRVLPGIASVGTGSIVNNIPTFDGIAFTHRPDSLYIVYKYVPGAGGDTALVNIDFIQADTSFFGGSIPLMAANQWTGLTVAFTQVPYGAKVPENLVFQFQSSLRLQAPKYGSVLNVEAVAFIYAAPSALVATSDAVTFCEGDSANLEGSVEDATNPALTYGWLKDGAAINGATTANYTATESGEYAFVATNGDVSDTSDVVAITVQTCTGIEAVDVATVSVYPNPVSNLLNVSATQSMVGFDLNIVDVTGRVVSTTALNGNNASINVSNLANGSYTYTIGNKANGVVKTNSLQIAK